MRNIWRLFTGDLKRMGGNTMTVLVILGLALLPSLFSWYNMLACWDVFGNTGNLTVAVANSDEGYESDLVPMRVNIGENVISALRANDQLHWVFTDEEDAIDGTQSGRYYAAVVIPPEFSRNMMTFYTEGSESALLRYYSNEKKSAIAPKVTDQGADQVSNQVNRVFTETLSEIALGLASSLSDYAKDADVDGSVASLAGHLDRIAGQMRRMASSLSLYGTLIESSQRLVADTGALLGSTKDSAGDVAESAADAKEAAEGMAGSLESAAQGLSEALEACVAAYDGMPDEIDATLDSAGTVAGDASAQLRARAVGVDSLARDHRELADRLQGVADALPAPTDTAGLDDAEKAVAEAENAAIGEASADLADLVARLRAAAQQEDAVTAALLASADNIDGEVQGAQEDGADYRAQAKKAALELRDVRAGYDADLRPTLGELADTLEHAVGTLASVGGALESAGSQMGDVAVTLDAKADDARGDIAGAAKKLEDAAADLEGLSRDIADALASGDADGLRDVIGSDPSAMATALSAPVSLERVAVYPVENFGSAMSPLYTTLALWIGALLMMVTLKVNPSRRTIEELDDPTPQQLFCGRFGVVAIISLMQSTTMALGNMFFLGVQVAEPLLYLVCYWASGLVFAFIIYTLVVSFANFGKALSVLLLILQVSGGGGSFPLQLLPQFFQDISPFLPITHVVNAMRAAMFGLYNGDFFVEMGVLVLFAVPLLLLGLVFRNPLIKVVETFVARVERSKLM